MTDSGYEPILRLALARLLDYLEGLDSRPVAATATVEELRSRLLEPLPEHPTTAEQALEDLVARASPGLVGSAGGRFFGWVIGGALPSAVAADWITSAWDQNAGLYSTSPAAAIVEEVCGLWLKDLLRLPGSATFALTTGCQLAHVTCLAAARHRLLALHGWDVDRRGLSGAPSIDVLTTTERHGSLERAVRLLGFGRDHLIELPVTDAGTLSPEVLTAALDKRRGQPLLVVLQAGDLNIAAFDDFKLLIPLAHEAGAWVHVDGAFGLWAAASPSRRGLLEGAELADSWATDGHKWLNVPFDCGYAFVADGAAHRATFSHRAGYLDQAGTARDQMDWTPEWSRRARGFTTYAALRQLGRRGMADLVDRCCDHAAALVAGIGALAGAEPIHTSALNQGLVRFTSPAPHATGSDHDRMTDAVIARVLEGGDAFFTGTTWRGRRAMRVSVCNWRTSRSDVERSVQAVARALAIERAAVDGPS